MAIEVKTSKKLKPEHLKGLEAIKDLKRMKRRVLVYWGNIKMKKEGIEILPFHEFCKSFLTV